MPAKPVTPAEFGALVSDLRAELAETAGHRRREFFTIPRRAAPKAFIGRPWVHHRAGAEVIADLAGMTPGSVTDLDRRARKARAERKTRGRRIMPPSEVTGGTRRWVIGEVALFVAARSDRRPPRREPGPGKRTPKRRKGTGGLPSPTDEQLLDGVTRGMREHGPGVTNRQIQESMRDGGYGADLRRIAPMLMQARVRHVHDALSPTDGIHGGELESLRFDGLVTASQVAAAFGVSLGALTHAVERHMLTPAKYEGGTGTNTRPLFDPLRLAVRKDGTKGPVDKDSTLAVDMDLS